MRQAGGPELSFSGRKLRLYPKSSSLDAQAEDKNNGKAPVFSCLGPACFYQSFWGELRQIGFFSALAEAVKGFSKPYPYLLQLKFKTAEQHRHKTMPLDSACQTDVNAPAPQARVLYPS